MGLRSPYSRSSALADWQPPGCPRAGVKVQSLFFRVVGDGVAPELATETGMLGAAEGQFGRAVHESVYPNRPGADATGNVEAGIEIAAPDRGREAVGGVVGDRDGFRRRAESQDRQDRTEDLFTRYFHGRFDTANDGRGHELPGRARQTMAAEYDLCAS